MTNLEKAIEIAELHKITYPAYEETSFEECYGSALQMAEWKDAQLKESLSEFENKLSEWLHCSLCANKEYCEDKQENCYCRSKQMINKMINFLLKEE